MAKYAIYSCEGVFREILPSARKQVPITDGGKDQFVYVGDDSEKICAVAHGCRAISFAELQNDPKWQRLINVGAVNPCIRNKVVGICQDAGFYFFSISDDTHVRVDNVEVGAGADFRAFAMAINDTQVGKHLHCNVYSYVARDCRIGDYVTLAPQVCCNERVQ